MTGRIARLFVYWGWIAKKMIKIFATIGILILGYGLLCLFVYFIQESMIFYPAKLPADYPFEFDSDYEELSVVTQDLSVLDGLLFTTDSPRGLIFYLHGNAGALDSWGTVASLYTNLKYDIFILDYRGYGKSEGQINDERQFYTDIQMAYNELKNRYKERDIVILGYSLGAAAAAKLAAENNPGQLILQAPYYSMLDLKQKLYPYLPDFILKYKFETYRYLDSVVVPVTIFHGDKDEVIYYGSSLKLKEHLKPTDQLIPLPGQFHNGITENPLYQEKLKEILFK